MALATRGTATGEFRLVTVVPSPICPSVFRPQHCAVWSDMRTQLWAWPMATSNPPSNGPKLGPLGLCGLTVEAPPNPSWPSLLLPQQNTLPSLSTEQAWLPPTDSATISLIGLDARLVI